MLSNHKFELVVALFSLYRSVWEQGSWVFYIVELAVTILMYHKASEIYHYIKVMEVGLKYEYQVKIFDLTCNILIQAHLFVSFESLRQLFSTLRSISALTSTGWKRAD